jgi:predicted P-loop ATPase
MDYAVSFYKNVYDMSGTKYYLEDVLHGIKNGKWKAEQEAYLEFAKKPGVTDDEVRKKKGLTPNITIAGVFKSCHNKDIIKATGLIGVDFDHVEDMEETRQILMNDPYVAWYFQSVSKTGYCAIIHIDPTKFQESYEGIEKYFLQNYGLITDPQCKNIARRRFLSYDPEVEINPQTTKVFKEYIQKPRGRPKREKPVSNLHSEKDIEYVLNQIESRQVDLTGDYESWYRIGFALINQYGNTPQAMDYFQRISQYHPEYTPEKTERKFRQLVQKNDGKVGIGTLYYLVKQAGLEPYTERTLQVARVAQVQKRAGVTKDSVVATLDQMDGIKPEESVNIVDAIYESDADIDTDQTLLDQIEMFIKRNYPIRYNTINLCEEFVNTGQQVTDRDVNTIYIQLKKAIGKEVTKSDVEAVINSNLIQSYNPIQDFFEKHKNRRPIGAIQALANTITPKLSEWTQTFCPDYVYYYLRKWMIGIVSSAHGHYSPLMLVLTGGQNTGKTEFFRRLLPDELQPYFDDSKQENAKDEEILLCKKLLILDDEFSGKNKQEIRRFKELSSKQKITQRRTYGKRHESFQRIAVFCGTCNDTQVLNDPTGNRRVIPIEVIKINHEAYNSIDKVDLLMEAYHAWKSGETHHFNSLDIETLNQATGEFEEHSMERELISKYFKHPEAGTPYEELTATEIKVRIELETRQHLSLRKVGQELKSLGFQCRSKRDGQYKWKQVYRVAQAMQSNPYV